jgi:hypothetical protein
MMDPTKVLPKGFHFSIWFTQDGIDRRLNWCDWWNVRPVDYYLIDFGLSIRYPAGFTDILDYGIYGQDRSVPEMSIDVVCNVFKVIIEVRYIGIYIRPHIFLLQLLTTPHQHIEVYTDESQKYIKTLPKRVQTR